jgi:two-component system KDP operon response regulator KdpE
MRETCDAQILVLTESGREREKVEALEAGADDCITKPFASAELVARVRVALRHRASAQRPARDSVIAVGDLRMDLASRVVFLDGAEIRLTGRQYRVLEVLMKNAGAVVTQQTLLREVWGPEHEAHANYLREYVHQLRRKLEKDPTRPRFLITEPAVGYRIRCTT